MTRACMGEKRGKALVCLFFLGILLLGWYTVGDYGRYWDELSEINIFRMSIMEYAQALPLEGLRRGLAEMGVTPISQSVEMDHNFSLYYPLALLAADPGLTVNQLSLIWRSYTWAVFVLGLFSLYAVCRRMGLSRPLCCVGVLLLLLSPRFFAHGHYNNKDIPLMTLCGLVLWQTLRLEEKPCPSRALWFALAAGLCVNTRIVGGAVCALCGGLLVASLGVQGRLNRRAWGAGAIALCGAAACYALLTPALLRDPAGYVQYVVKSSYNFTRWNGTMLFMGQEIDLSAGKPPFYYLPVMVGLTTPLAQLGLALLGGGGTLARLGRERLGMLKGREGFAGLLSLALWVLPLLCAMVLRVRIYNGWRHFFFLYVPMMASAAWGLKGIARQAASRPWLRRSLGTGLACVLAIQGGLLAANHPFQYAYYNPLVPPAAAETQYELDYWNLSVYQALQELEKVAGEEGVITVACTDTRTRTGYAFATTLMTPEEEARFALAPYEEENRGSFYILANTTYYALSGVRLPQDVQPVVAVESYGATLCTVYAQTPKEAGL